MKIFNNSYYKGFSIGKLEFILGTGKSDNTHWFLSFGNFKILEQ